MANREETTKKIIELKEKFDELFKTHPSITSDEYLEMAQIRYEIAKIRKNLELTDLEEKYQNGDLNKEVRNENNVEEYKAQLAREIEKNFESETCLYEESGFRWALGKIENASASSLSDLIPSGLITDIKIALARKGIKVTTDENARNKKQCVKESMLSRSFRNNEIKRELSSIDIVLSNLVADEVNVDDVKVKVMR